MQSSITEGRQQRQWADAAGRRFDEQPVAYHDMPIAYLATMKVLSDSATRRQDFALLGSGIVQWTRHLLIVKGIIVKPEILCGEDAVVFSIRNAFTSMLWLQS